MNPYRIEITKEEDTLAFGIRYPGEIGRDILAIKVALGIIQTYEDVITENSTNTELDSEPVPMDIHGWFECSTGLGIDIRKASTFDLKTQTAIMNFQMKNQFLILCYLFEKYGVRDLIPYTSDRYLTSIEKEEYSSAILVQLEAIVALFDSNFGIITEATLAVLHGWIPQTSLSSTGYLHRESLYSDDPTVTDIIPEVLFNDFKANMFGQTMQDLIESGAIPQQIQIDQDPQKLLAYTEKVSSSSNWIKTDYKNGILKSDFPFGAIDYKTKLSGTSSLYRAAISIMENKHVNEHDDMIPPDTREENLRRMFYPDPFTDPDPFFIDSERIGFFMETPFMLSSQGPLPRQDPNSIMRLEDEALRKVLEFYDKPDTWNHVVGSDHFSMAHFGGTSEERRPRPSHSGVYPDATTSDSPLTIEEKRNVQEFRDLEAQLELTESKLQRLIEITSDHSLEGELIARASGLSDPDVVAEKLSSLGATAAMITFQMDIFPATISTRQESFWVVSTDSIISEFLQSPGTDEALPAAQSWRALEGFGRTRPLIKFEEYRTPSLRPSQAYRAFFIINKEKLDLITSGNSFSRPSSVNANQDLEPQPEADNSCGDESSEQSERTFEEYKAHARRKRKQIVRKLREHEEKTRRSYGAGEIDLGNTGPIDWNSTFPSLAGLSNQGDDYAYTKAILKAASDSGADLFSLGTLTDSLNDLNGYVEAQDMNWNDSETKKMNPPLVITLSELRKRVEKARKDLIEAAQIIKQEGIQFAAGSKFQGAQEAAKLSQFVSQLTELASEDADIKYAMTEDEDTVLFQFMFEPAKSSTSMGPKIGRKIKSVNAIVQGQGLLDGNGIGIAIPPFATNIRNSVGPWGDHYQSDAQKLKISKLLTLSRARTVNYISRIVQMTSPVSGGVDGFILSFFDDGRGACKELGIDADKQMAIGYVGKFTSGLKTKMPKNDPSSGSWSRWAKKSFKDPAVEWWKKSEENWDDSFEDTFDGDQALRTMGELCTLEDLYKEFFDKLDIASLLCDYIKCIKFPGFELQLPKIHIPPFPKIPIIGWYAGLVKFIIENIKGIFQRLLCTFVKTLIDKLAIPFCAGQLEEFIAAGPSANTPIVAEALASALVDTGITAGNEEEAKQYFSDATRIVTGQELCYLLSGKVLDNSAMTMLSRLAEENGLSEDLDSPDAIANYFGVLGSFMPSQFCEELQNISTPFTGDCKEVADELQSIRNRLQSGDSTLTEEEIRSALDLAEKNLEDQRASLQALSGSDLSSLAPPLFAPGNPSAVMSEFPEFLNAEMQRTSENVFSQAHSSYVSALGSYVSSMSIPTPDMPKAGDDNYMDIDILRLEAASTQLALYAGSLDSQSKSIIHAALSQEPGYDRADELTTQNIDEIIEAEQDLMRAIETAYTKSTAELAGIPRQMVDLYDQAKEIASKMLVAWRGTMGILAATTPDTRGPNGTDGPGHPPRAPDGEIRRAELEQKFRSELDILEAFDEAFDPNAPGSVLAFRLLAASTRSVTNKFNNYPQSALKEEEINRIILYLGVADAGTSEMNPYVFRQQLWNTLKNYLVGFEALVDRKKSIEKDFWYTDGHAAGRSKEYDDYRGNWNGYEQNRDRGRRNWNDTSQQEGQQRDVYAAEYARRQDNELEYLDLDDGISQRGKLEEISTRSEDQYLSLNHLNEMNRESIRRQAILSEAKSPVQVTPANAILLYAEFEKYRIKKKDGTGYHYVHKKSSVPSSESENFIARASGRATPGEYDPLWFTSNDPTSFLKNVIANDDQLDRHTRTLSYEEFHEKSIDVTDSDEFILHVSSLNNYISHNAVSDVVEAHRCNLVLASNDPLSPMRLANYTSGVFDNPGDDVNASGLFLSALEEIGWTGLRGDATDTPPEDNDPDMLTAVANRVNSLSETITSILQRRPNLVSGKHLPLVQDVIKRAQTLVIIEEEESDNIKLEFTEGPYRPSVLLTETKSKGEYDGYRFEVESDTLLGLSLGGKKDFNYCKKLPNRLTHGSTMTGREHFPVREAYSRTIMESFKEQTGASDETFPEGVIQNLYEDVYTRVRHSLLNSIFDNVRTSKMFQPEYAEELTKRVGGKPFYNKDNCLTNRFGLTEVSILSFKKMILDDAASEVMSEYARAENSVHNRDIDDLGPFELALQNLAVKAYVRVCLVDIMLKGGIAFAAWDIEPVVSSDFYIDYAIAHIRKELEQSRALKGTWKTLIERVMGVSNPYQALEILVKREIVKLPDYSKQIFNPDSPDMDIDYHEWYIKKSIPLTDISEDVHIARWVPSPPIQFPVQYGEEQFKENQSSFVIEEYVDLEGELLDDQWARQVPVGLYYTNRGRQMIKVERFNQLLKVVRDSNEEEEYLRICTNSSIKHGMRLVQVNVGKHHDVVIPFPETAEEYDMEPFFERLGAESLNKLYNTPGISDLTFTEKSYRTIVTVGTDFHLSLSIPLLKHEREITPENCASAFLGVHAGIDQSQSKVYMREGLTSKQGFQDLFEHLFPVRRYMAQASVFSTSILSGYNDLPTIFDPTKNMIAFAIEAAATPFTRMHELTPMSQMDLQKRLTDNFPTDPDDTSCLELPELGKEFWEKFFKDLGELFMMLPSVLLRGIANTLDPAYKEMRSHYMNCDINKLTMEGLTFDTKDHKRLINGLKIPSENHRAQRAGTYAPIVLSSIYDFYSSQVNPFLMPKRMLKTVMRIVTYAYNGNAPFLDLSGAFKIPCADVDEKWLERPKGMYDAGAFGRYGHPLSPFTLLALITPELDSDKERRNSSCKDTPSPNDCEDV